MAFLSDVVYSLLGGFEVPSPTKLALANMDTWEYSIPLTTQWIAKIEPIPGASTGDLLRNIGYGTTFDKNFWQIPPQLQNILFAGAVNNDILGTFFVREMTLPSESFQVQNAVSEGIFGYLGSTVGGTRAGPTERRLEIDFISTNLDFSETIIRPWIITSAYKGLLARPPHESIKCNITIVKYSRGLYSVNARPMTIMYQFFDCVPYLVGSKQLNYNGEDVQHIGTQWTFNTYSTMPFNLLQQQI